MWYIIIIIVAILTIKWVEYKTFHWKTVVEYLWKQIYHKADSMAGWLKQCKNTEDEKGIIENYKKEIIVRGNIINSVLDFVNYLKKENDENVEDETFGYGRFDFDIILGSAKRDPDIFKRITKKEVA